MASKPFEAVLVGAGDLAREVLSLIKNDDETFVNPVGYISEERDLEFENASGLEFAGLIDESCNAERTKYRQLPLLLCVGDPTFRERFWTRNKKASLLLLYPQNIRNRRFGEFR